jgi:hypothetical protein
MEDAMKSCKLSMVLMVCFQVAISYAQLPAPVGHWTFDEGEGYTTADVSGNGNDGMIWENGVTWTTDTPTGTGFALQFEGEEGAVDIGDPEILKIVGDITLAAWVKTDAATSQWHNIIVKGHGVGEIVLRLDGNGHPSQFWCGSYDTADHMVISYDLADELNTWIHLVGTYDDDNQLWTLYFNGEWVSDTFDPIGAVAVDRGWAIGARASADGTYPTERHYTGCIDDVCIYDVPLSEDEVLQLYQEITTGVEQKTQALPGHYSLCQNYPNPFNPTTTIEYTLKVNGKVRISVYDLTGKEVVVLADGIRSAGNHEVRFDGANLTSGIYFYKLQTAEQVITRKMTLVK